MSLRSSHSSALAQKDKEIADLNKTIQSLRIEISSAASKAAQDRESALYKLTAEFNSKRLNCLVEVSNSFFWITVVC